MGGTVSLSNSDPKLLACLATLANGTEEEIVASPVQSNSGVPSDVRGDGFSGSAIIEVLFVNLHHRV